MATQKRRLARLSQSLPFKKNDQIKVVSTYNSETQIVKRRIERRIDNDIPLLPTWWQPVDPKVFEKFKKITMEPKLRLPVVNFFSLFYYVIL